ncbi:MAG: hypothetical protein LWW81_02665 [Rhodocyclales bacterium]|nr:hypothetical protein [Rhodocyclales bacterium]
MVLVQVDGQLNVTQLGEKIGNPQLVQAALVELEQGGFIVATLDALAFDTLDRNELDSLTPSNSGFSAMSEFSTFDTVAGNSSGFSTFGEPTQLSVPAPEQAAEPKPVEEKPITEAPAVRERKSFPWGKLLLVFVLLLLLLPVGVFFYPYDRFRPAIETAASEWLGGHVQIGRVSMGFSPTPTLLLKEVRLADAEKVVVEEIKISSPFSLLSKQPGGVMLHSVELAGVSLQPAQLLTLSRLVKPEAEAAAIRVGKLRISGLTLNLGEQLATPELSGELEFAQDGSFSKGQFRNAENNLKIQVTPTGQAWALAIEGRDWRPKTVPTSFGLFEASGTLQRDSLILKNVDSSFLNGILKGNWQLNWSPDGLSMNGDGEVLRLDSKALGSVFLPSLKLEGQLSATGRFKAKGSDWQALWSAVEGSADLEVTQGVLLGVDPVDAARRNGVEVQGGSIRFQHLQTALAFSPKQIALRNIRLDVGGVKGSGQVTINESGVAEGNIDVLMQTSVASQHVPVRVFGNVSMMSAQSRK